MSLRTAGRQSPLLLAGVLLFGGWVALNLLRVFDAMESIWVIGSFEPAFRETGAIGTAVGQTVVSGVVGLLVMLAVFGLLVALYAALSEDDPTPDRFPPERDEEWTEA